MCLVRFFKLLPLVQLANYCGIYSRERVIRLSAGNLELKMLRRRRKEVRKYPKLRVWKFLDLRVWKTWMSRRDVEDCSVVKHDRQLRSGRLKLCLYLFVVGFFFFDFLLWFDMIPLPPLLKNMIDSMHSLARI